jgi:hypothetical protein
MCGRLRRCWTLRGAGRASVTACICWPTTRATGACICWPASKLYGVAETHFGIKLGIREYRHVAIWIMRTYGLPILAHLSPATATELGQMTGRDAGERADGSGGSGGRADTADNLQAGHSTPVAERVYAVQRDMLHELSSYAIESFRLVSHVWHMLLGFYGRRHSLVEAVAVCSCRRAGGAACAYAALVSGLDGVGVSEADVTSLVWNDWVYTERGEKGKPGGP